MKKTKIYLDPSYEAFYENRIFDTSDNRLNRDNQLLPFIRLQESAQKNNCLISTADYIYSDDSKDASHYYSLGIVPDFSRLIERNIIASGMVLMEPPAVAPILYNSLPNLAKNFRAIFLHNTHGDGYSLKNVNSDLLYKFYWPIPFHGVIDTFWNNRNRLKKIVVVNGHHKPVSSVRELYSKRIEAIAALSQYEVIDLFGLGWKRLFCRTSFWWPYLKNRRKLLRVYRGACGSKYQCLSKYLFSLCFENMSMDGYLTEKIFDCFYSGTIPIYLGAPDIHKYIPKDTFIDARNFKNWKDMLDFVFTLSDEQITAMREAGKNFMHSDEALKYFNSLENMILTEF